MRLPLIFFYKLSSSKSHKNSGKRCNSCGEALAYLQFGDTHSKTSLITTTLNWFYFKLNFTKSIYVFCTLRFEAFWQFLNKNMCSDWMNSIYTRATQLYWVDSVTPLRKVSTKIWKRFTRYQNAKSFEGNNEG